ncbi:MAG: hypothetical protein QG608_3186 [Actinomycetota bacterium]|nr:hypothetical protein [Actinomycetota bacterium]
MRILMTAFACHPGKGSEPGNGWHWARALAERGHLIDLVTRSEGERAVLAECGRLGLDNIRLHLLDVPVRRNPPHAEARRLLGYETWLRACARFVRDLPTPDVAHHTTWGSLHFGPHLELEAPVVTGPVGGSQVAPARHKQYFDGEWRDEWVRSRATSTFLRLFPGARRTARCDHVFATNKVTLRDLQQRLHARSASLLSGDALACEHLLTAPREPGPGAWTCDRGPTFVWVGSIVPRKAARLAVEAFARVAGQCRGARLVLVGDGRLLPIVRARVEDLGLTKQVTFTGRVPWAEVRRHLDAADCFVFSSLRDSGSAQVLEAAGRAVPTVALERDGICDVMPRAAGVMVSEETDDLPGSLAAGMLQVVEDRERWSRMSAACLQWAGEHTWPRQAAVAEAVYHRLRS